jgi:peptidoglycan/xylan/chitin deacetylase (PgdA/CDA1 family)
VNRRTFLRRAGLAAGGAVVGGAGVAGAEQYRILEQIRWSGKAVGAHRPPGVVGTVIAYRVSTDEPEVALTFDDGPSPEYTGRILQILAEHDATATFFMVGRAVLAHPELAQAVAAAGHELGNHTWSHADLAIARAPEVTSQLSRAEAAIVTVTGTHPTLYRPPYGYFSGATAMVAAGMHYPMVLWDLLFDRSRTATAAGNVASLASRAQPGSIILGHDGGSMSCEVVVQALPALIDRLRERGLRLVTVSQLLARQYPNLATLG